MSKKKTPTFERETVDGFLSRGGEIKKVAPSIAGDLARMSEPELVEMLQGAKYDDALTRDATSWFVPDDVLASIDEEYGNRGYDNPFED